jgi:hypothetical protein
MTAEYFPPKADIVMQNETSTDCYIIVSGAVVSTYPLLSATLYDDLQFRFLTLL